jgi:MFS transporter, ACS family, D-galactonate transporter
VKAIAAQYPQPVKVLGTVDPATLAALKANPANLVAQTRALSQLSGLPPAQVGRVALLGARYRPELATLAAVDPATLGTLQANPTDRAAGARAVGEIAVRFGIPPSAALARLQAVGRVPPADLLFLRANGPRVQQAGAALRSVSTVPPADLAYLAQNGPKVAKAQKDNPGQWQTWWWICFAGQVLFIPFVFLLTGHSSPRKAREQEREHERTVQSELARLEEARASAA